MAYRRVTAPRKERLNYLANILYDFLPLTSNSEYAITFTSIFAESSVEDYLDGDNKTQALKNGFEDLYRHHKILPFTIIRKVIPAAIDYRMYKRKPLRREELDELANCLYDLDIDMRKEIEEVEVNESLPEITVPPEDLKERLRNHNLNPAITLKPLQLFEDGHFNEAVRKAAEIFEDRVQELSESDEHGRSLMGISFNDDSLLNTSNIEPENQQAFIDGYKFLTMGMMASIRNIFSHGDEERRSPEECFEMLLLINWLFRYIEGN